MLPMVDPPPNPNNGGTEEECVALTLSFLSFFFFSFSPFFLERLDVPTSQRLTVRYFLYSPILCKKLVALLS